MYRFPPTKHPKGQTQNKPGWEEFPNTPVSTVLEPIVTLSFAALCSGKNHQQQDPSMMHPLVFDLCTWVKVFFTKKQNTSTSHNWTKPPFQYGRNSFPSLPRGHFSRSRLSASCRRTPSWVEDGLGGLTKQPFHIHLPQWYSRWIKSSYIPMLESINLLIHIIKNSLNIPGLGLFVFFTLYNLLAG